MLCVVVTAHWIEDKITVSSAESPPLYFDYYGFPPESYQFKYPAPGSPQLASTVSTLLNDAGIENNFDSKRGWDHGKYLPPLSHSLPLILSPSGVFVPLLLMFPQAVIPIVSISLHRSLDPDYHLRVGQALAPLREQGVLILGSGASFHNFDYFFANDSKTKREGAAHSHHFDQFLEETLTGQEFSASERLARLRQWSTAPSARQSHKVGQEEHLLPLHVVAGAGLGSVARRIGEPASASEIAISSFEWPVSG
jgi:aromatic ring-opening dioxygenase catalytic subunit (LigB family)